MALLTVALNNGLTMPLVGLGTWKSKKGEVHNAVKAAIEVGYRHIDCAHIYQNEDEVGQALREAFEAGTVKREDLWVTSKLWNNSKMSNEMVEEGCRATLKNLGLEYLDLYLVHWPVVTQTNGEGAELKPSLAENWAAMELLVEKGLVKSIGVSNYSAKKLQSLKATAKIFPAVNQVELHPLWRQDGLLKACAEMGTHVTAYSPLGSPDSADQFKHNGRKVLDVPELKAIGDKYGKTAAQVALRWGVQRGTSIAPKSVTPSRIAENFDVQSWTLTDEEMAQLSALEPQERMLSGLFWCTEKGPYKTLTDLWDE
mmetsp:Transcript_43697/g.103152  ORF Transcript_43697/g.103152 Transcript_43697/m.103152 type:complete len:313 (+) Transcript_43697:63-1001(+)